QNNSVSSFSSRGATQWWFTPWYEYSYPPGLIKPDVAAPGGSPGITSLSYTNNTGYVGGWQGTSMSCPHVTGTIALMLSKDPSLTPEELDSIIEETCLDLGTAGKDNYYGAGLINALDAVNAVGGGSATSGTFYCKNVGDANLDVTNIVKSASWITSVSPTAFTVVPNDSQGVTVNIDESGLPGGTYHDTLWISSNDPDEDPYAEVVILSIGTGIEEEPAVKIVPAAYTIKCYPNPARNAASVRFSLPRKGHISLDVYDVTGRNVSTIVNGEFNSGTHSIVWNRKDNKGVKVPQGIYFIRLKAEGMEAQGKLILLN
ncbi:S8 family peptidase, partial [candidate division WOR-3 bacterium]|nr:S8 family peptidase [candidate division WOR-3 bacterium]